MKKIVYLVLALGSQGVLADLEKNQAAYDMMLSMMKSVSSDGLAEVASCLGVSQATLNDAMDRATQRCFDRHKHEPYKTFSENMDICVSAIDDDLGFAQADLNRCEIEEDKIQRELAEEENKAQHELDELDRQMATLTQQLDQLYYSDASDSEIAALERKLENIEKIYIEKGDMLYDTTANAENGTHHPEEMMKVLSQASERSLHLVTLPIYENSQVMMHMIDGEQTGIKHSLPAATFSSKDEAQKVLAYYRKKLPEFKYKNLGGGGHLLMESMPDNFDLVEHMNALMSTPHVFIRVFLDEGSVIGVPAGTKSTIQVIYREQG